MTIGQRLFQFHSVAWFMTNLFLFVIWLVTGAGFPWFLFPALGWGIALAIHATVVWGNFGGLTPGDSARYELE
jgi:hypothetical protein